MQSINKINSTSIQVKSRSGNVLQLFLFAEKRLEFSPVRTRYKKQKLAPHFFALITEVRLGVSPIFLCWNSISAKKRESLRAPLIRGMNAPPPRTSRACVVVARLRFRPTAGKCGKKPVKQRKITKTTVNRKTIHFFQIQIIGDNDRNAAWQRQ